MFIYNLWWDTIITKRGNGKQHMFIYNLWWYTITTKRGNGEQQHIQKQLNGLNNICL